MKGLKRFVPVLVAVMAMTFSCRTVTPKSSPPKQTAEQRLHVNPIVFDGNFYDAPDTYRALMSYDKSAVCAIKYLDSDRRHYQTTTYKDLKEAKQAGAHVTHMGSCGTCSSLQDLSVYLNNRDLTTSARRCGLVSWAKPSSIRCFKKMGFSDMCAATWYYNALNTRKHCLWTCLWSFIKNEKNNPDGQELNDCLRCDEEHSGPLFKVMAGRTRRNSGLSSEITRKPYEIAVIKHDYF